MKRRTRIISAVCAAALLGSAMTMPAAAYPMHMNGEAEGAAGTGAADAGK